MYFPYKKKRTMGSKKKQPRVIQLICIENKRLDWSTCRIKPKSTKRFKPEFKNDKTFIDNIPVEEKQRDANTPLSKRKHDTNDGYLQINQKKRTFKDKLNLIHKYNLIVLSMVVIDLLPFTIRTALFFVMLILIKKII